jgi:hypothetical protein
MIYGFDSAYAPDDATLADMVGNGWGFYAGYIGGNALHVWSHADWARVRNAGLKLIPIWVAPYGTPSYARGVADGNGCLVAMQVLGFSGTMLLDVENGATPSDYIRGFVDAMHAGSAGVALYGSWPTINACEQFVDHAFVADWSGQIPPGSWEGWQYATGPTVDFDVVVDSYPFATLA